MFTTCERKFSPRATREIADQSARTDLPDDVFEAGEVKPSKPSKKKAPNGTPAPKKRNATEVCPGHRFGSRLRTASPQR